MADEFGFGIPNGRVHLLRPFGWTLCGLRLGLEKDWHRRPFASDPCKVCVKAKAAADG